MTDAQLQRHAEQHLAPDDARLPLARVLMERNIVTPWQLFFGLRCQGVWDVSLPEILVSRGWVSEQALNDLVAERNRWPRLDLIRTPPAQSTVALLPATFCLKYNALPWARIGNSWIIATGRPSQIDKLIAALPTELVDAQFAICDPQVLQDYVSLHARRELTHRAERTVDAPESCRNFTAGNMSWKLASVAAFWVALAAIPSETHFGFLLLVVWMIATMLAATSLRVAALWYYIRHQTFAPTHTPIARQERWAHRGASALPAVLDAEGRRARLPRISIMVPLFQETEIATALISRLTKLTYPRALLEVVLVLEEKDKLTHETITHTRLPRWMRVVEVPAGSGITTKPRALNYALPFCKGDIIGIWDAEDAPAADQLENVAAHFSTAAPNVACVQGVLDYYNPYTNWLSRCFSIEYAAWFRLLLPALSRLGLPIPLGGTTLYLRRSVIEDIGGWDSHNVTEDADLGMRLARRGYRTELIETVTQEEANCQPIAWVRQRSRWLKGYMATYLVHMRAPRKLLRDLGLRQFLGFQLVFLCSLSQFLLAPFFWVLWGGAFGLWFPLYDTLPPNLVFGFFLCLVLAGTVNGATWLAAVHASKRPRLYLWSFSMMFYFPLATVAAYKGIIEMVLAPFYWDKTNHGKTSEAVEHGLSDRQID